MERYFESIFEKHEEIENAIEECMYEIDLLDSFGVATEDSTVATPGGSSSTSSSTNSGSSSGNTAENNPAANNLARMNSGAEQDAQNSNNNQTNREAKGEADSKTKTEIANKIKEIAEQISSFIRETIVSMKSEASDMLKENADTVAHVNDLVHRNKRNPELNFKDYDYNNQFIGEFGVSLDRAFARYNDCISKISGLINDYKQAISTGGEEECTAIENKLKEAYNKESAGETQADLPMESKLVSPILLVCNAMHLDKNAITELNQLKNAIYNKYKGTTDSDKAPKVYKVEGNEARVDSAIEYLRKYRDYMKDVNACMDKLKTAAEEYNKICSDINAFPSYTQFSKTLLLGVVNAISNHISQFNTLTKYCITIIKERGIAAENLVKAVYSDTVITKKENTEQGTTTSREADALKQKAKEKMNKTKPRQFAQEYHTAKQRQQDRLAQYDREDNLRALRRR